MDRLYALRALVAIAEAGSLSAAARAAAVAPSTITLAQRKLELTARCTKDSYFSLVNTPSALGQANLLFLQKPTNAGPPAIAHHDLAFMVTVDNCPVHARKTPRN